MRNIMLLVLSWALVGCISTQPIPESGKNFHLDRCTPFLNCVSSESIIDIYQVPTIRLATPLTFESWQQIEQATLGLAGASLKESRYGYIRVVCSSNVFRFPDFVEVLVSQDGQSLDVRSQSLLGLFDFGVNRSRVETLRDDLIASGLAMSN